MKWKKDEKCTVAYDLLSPSMDISWRQHVLKLIDRYRQTRFSSRRVRRRVVFKHGDCNVVQGNVAKRRRKYLQDIFTTLVDAQWRWTLLVFAMNFFLSWLGFAIIWWLIVFWHGDLEPTAQANSSWVPCVRDVNTFTSCFLFSVETQHTIGYGAKHTTDECLEAIFVMCLQSITGVMIQAFMVGIVFAKLSRPKKRTQTLLFSRNAVICQRDGQLCLMFRVGDMRKSHIIEAHVRAQLIKKKVTREGEVLPFYQQELKVGGDGEEDKIFFIWPTTIVHKITPSSPLYNLSASDMLRERFEIVVILEGVIESTGMTTQARSSYLPNEILWGHRFEPLVSFKKETGEHEVDYNLFNNTYEVDTPLCSAQSLDRVIGLHQHNSDLQKYGISTTTNTSLV
uniref:Inward rectifier potassium channel 1B n=1 Tax=Nilaparvata lugens TaxID=108931 RepID=A0A9E8G7N0_NILLU|nr:inward rectifier potassium channel 1B [Nilaparvata lugens]